MNRFPYFFWPNCGYNWWPSTHLYKQRFSSVQSLDRLDRLGDRTDDSAEILLQSFLQEATVSSSDKGRDIHSLMLSIQHFFCQPCHPSPSKTPLRVILDRLACDMPKPCKFPSLDSCQKMFLWTHKEVDLASHPVIGLMLQVGDAEKFLRALGFKILDYIFQSWQAGTMFLSHRLGWR